MTPLRGGKAAKGPATALAVALLMPLLLNCAPVSSPPQQRVSGHTVASLLPASLGFAAAPQIGAAPSSSNPTYDEQIGMTFTQNMTSLSYNVTALAQVDANGYGPAYVLNGLTDKGFWYQVGISYHWPSSSGSYNPNFGFSYQVYGPTGKPVYPANGGAGLGGFSKAVHSGDAILLTLAFSGTAVQMSAQDWNTGAAAKTSFGAQASSKFIGNPWRSANGLGFFTGLMTEWYHIGPYVGNEGKVAYTNQLSALASAWMWVDEFDTTKPASPLFVNQTQTPVTFSNEQQLYPFVSNGATSYGSAHEFITGLLNTAASHVAILPANSEPSAPSFYASYTLAGLSQTAEIGAGAGSVVEADPGTSVTISLDASTSTPAEKWLFSILNGTSVSFKAGQDVSYVYYHLVRETVAYQVAGAGGTLPSSSVPALIYKAPPSSPSAMPVQVEVTQPLGNSPTTIFVVLGSDVRVSGSISGVNGARWAASAQNWTATGPDTLPNPIQFYYQYRVSLGYSLVGGGAPPTPPSITATSLGNPTPIAITSNATTAWFDAGSGYSFTKVLNGSTQGERWQDPAAENNNSANQTISSPDAVLSQVYTHQYHADLGVNDPRGGSISQGSGWLEAGSILHAGAVSSSQWQFERWDGSGPGAYSGPSPTIDLTVKGPLNERAIFYVQLAIEADQGTRISYSYGSQSGTVQPGSTKTLYVPPSSNMTISASPATLIYSFASWEGSSVPSSSSKPTLSLIVSSPTAVVGTSSYNYVVILGAMAAAAVALLAGSLLLRARRRGRVPPFISATSSYQTMNS